MRITPNPKMILRFRLVQLIACSGVIALGACQDVTGPETEAAAPNTLRLSQSSTDQLANLASSLDDMTGRSLAILDDNSKRSNIVGVLNGLKGHLNSGNTPLIQQDVTQVRGILSSLTYKQQVEMGPVDLAMDFVQYILKGISK